MARRPGMRQGPSFWRRLDAASRHAWPGFCTLFGLFLIGLPLGLPGQAELRPTYAMACVFFWSLYRPAALPAPLVAVIGLLLDLLNISPLGLWAVLLLLLQGSTLAARRRLLPVGFLLNWLAFIGLTALFSTLFWAMQCLLTLSLLTPIPLGVQILACAGAYPGLAALFIRAHRGAAAAELA
jgi:rod shape-determining protein MreD